MSKSVMRIDQPALLVVDLQEKLLAAVRGAGKVVTQSIKLIEGCKALGVPMAATEHYPKGLGPTIPDVRHAMSPDAPIFEKVLFSACTPQVLDWLKSTGRKQVLICGLESHVCMLQTALDLLENGYQTAMAWDASGSRTKADMRLAMRRIDGAGVVPVSVEMALFEMVREASNPLFKAILPIVK